MYEEKYMDLAIKNAKTAFKKGDVPVGCVIVKNGKVIAQSYNKKEKKKQTTRHAEIEAIEKASKKIRDWRLNDCEMYVTLEPCCMCAGAILNARLKCVYIGVMEQKYGCCGSAHNLLNDDKFTTKVECYNGYKKDECLNLLQSFFRNRREKGYK